MTGESYKLELTNPNVLTIVFSEIQAGWEQWILLGSDRHHDNKRCRRDLELRHLNKARDRHAMVLDFGDLFCAMQGKYDPRSSMDDIRPEDVGANYLDRIVDHAAEFYSPYADMFKLLAPGNHEISIRDRHHTYLTSNLVHRLNNEHGGSAVLGGFSGWVRFQFVIHQSARRKLLLHYHHGYGGGGPVTRGTIQSNRQAVYLSNADVVVNGHTHDAWELSIKRIGLSEKGKVVHGIQRHVRIPGYKDDYQDGFDGWATIRGMPPKPLGCYWMRLHLADAKTAEIGVDIMSTIS